MRETAIRVEEYVGRGLGPPGLFGRARKVREWLAVRCSLITCARATQIAVQMEKEKNQIPQISARPEVFIDFRVARRDYRPPVQSESIGKIKQRACSPYISLDS